MIQIKEYKDMYAEEISRIVIENLLKINSKDYGIEYVQKSAKEFTVPEIQKNFPKRTKVFVALENNLVVGISGLDKSWYNDDGEYWILTVFVDISYHKQGIGKMLIKKVEDYAKEINAKKLVIPASIYGCEFYHKLGYKYKDWKKELFLFSHHRIKFSRSVTLHSYLGFVLSLISPLCFCYSNS